MGHAVLGKQIKLLIVSTVSKGNMSNVRGKMASLFAVTEIFSLYILSAQKMSFCNLHAFWHGKENDIKEFDLACRVSKKRQSLHLLGRSYMSKCSAL